jgi:hypothetical protein
VVRFPLVTVAAAAAGAMATAALFGDTPASRRDADLLRQKVATITARAERPARLAGRTTVTEREVNAYLVFDGREQLPAGVVEPSVAILGTGRLAARAVVDLDAVRRAKASPSLLDPTNYLTGRLPVTAAGLLQTREGIGRFQLERATIGGVPVPKMLLQEIVSFYSRTPEKPSGIGLDDPFSLPARIREIQVERGQAIIVQ